MTVSKRLANVSSRTSVFFVFSFKTQLLMVLFFKVSYVVSSYVELCETFNFSPKIMILKIILTFHILII
jgi:hypothetical protein